MYIPKNFQVTDQQTIDAFIHANGFGQLTSNHNGMITATHLVFLYEPEQRRLVTHLARNNPQWQDIDGQEVLVTLQGPHGYISPTWYENRRGVPTWDYQAVHLYGACQTFTEPHRLKEIVERTAEKYEAASDQPWDGQYNEKMYQAIVGLEIAITDIQAKFKLSQNRTHAEQQRLIEELRRAKHDDLAAAIKRVNIAPSL